MLKNNRRRSLILEWTASIDILTYKLVELSEKERKASDLLYGVRRAAEIILKIKRCFL